MKKNFVLLALVLTSIISLKYSTGPASTVGQAYTGAPGESGTLCSSCHSDGTFGIPTATLVVTNAMGETVTSYAANDTFQISLTATAGTGTPSGYGFQLTVLDENDSDVANFLNPSTNAKISVAAAVAGGRTYAEHTSASVTNTFTFDWIAPSGGTGGVTFFYNLNLVNGNGGTGGDSGGSGYSTAMNESVPTVKVLGTLEINNVYTLPIVDGAANQVLTTDGAGTVSWMDAASPFTSGSTSTDNFKNANNQNTELNTQKVEINNLKGEVVLLKSEIEALKKLILKLTEK